MRNWWQGLSPPTRMVIRLTTGLLIVGAVLYAITTIRTTQAHAFDIVTGTASPYVLKAGFVGVLLAIVGYLFAPAVAGTILAAVIDSTQRDRAPTAESIESQLSAKLGPQLTAIKEQADEAKRTADEAKRTADEAKRRQPK